MCLTRANTSHEPGDPNPLPSTLNDEYRQVLRLKDKYSVQPRVPGVRPVSAIRFAPNGMWLAVGEQPPSRELNDNLNHRERAAH